ncbi:substrate-binding domain-containing protein [Bacillus marinisedimentorum]|uniref:substrate-binding domain-containing protein n=1 Tax=Bacillus marinisedimentorum TaxID=1821260 RepID=UPI001FE04F24|nr:substrate-binding domain-containing protein [Bacillus marinisedimentorum]
MKKSFLFLIGAMLTALLTACGNVQSIQEADGGGKENAAAEQPKSSFILATTTSTQDSGLLDKLVPMFEEQNGYMVKTIAVGTGKALEMGENGEADALLTHAPDSEQVLVDNGDVTNYQLVMHNDFVIAGPGEDPAGIKGAKSPGEALKMIADSESVFVSRGDDSGTHKKEKSLWEEAELQPGGKWYQETGQGMGGTIRVASEKSGYTLTDRATYLALHDELSMEILVEGDESLKNIYHVMQVNSKKSDKINSEAAEAFVDFMVSKEAQDTIEQFGIEQYGQPLFFPDVK